jgi:nucleotide-binding universal stress UspA family protein
MYSKILVPLDGSDIAECVLPYVESVATWKKPTEITFLYVIQPLDIPLADRKFTERIEAEARSGAKSYLDKLMEKIKIKENVKHVVRVGKSAETIIDYAAEHKIKLIVMATHGRSGISRWTRGSVADKVLHNANVPVWLIKADAATKTFLKKGQKIKILVTLDGSKLAEESLASVTELAQQYGIDSVELTLFRVSELFSPPYIYPPEMPISIEEYLEYEKKRTAEICRSYLENIEKQLTQKGLNAKTAVEEGIPADVIINHARKNSIDLIVMSTHGRTGFSHWAFGSIAEKVLKGAPCPVFLVRSGNKKPQT